MQAVVAQVDRLDGHGAGWLRRIAGGRGGIADRSAGPAAQALYGSAGRVDGVGCVRRKRCTTGLVMGVS